MTAQIPPVAKKSITLTVSFDADQESPQLLYHFKADNSDTPNPTLEGGRYASAIYLCHGAYVNLIVQGWSDPTRLSSYDIKQCCVITRPKIIQLGGKIPTLFARPSPFATVAVPCHTLVNEFETSTVGRPPAEVCITKTWKGTLQVGDVDGRWEISFVLAVALQRPGGSAPELRVFSFDPEGEVGTGAIIREDDLGERRARALSAQ